MRVRDVKLIVPQPLLTIVFSRAAAACQGHSRYAVATKLNKKQIAIQTEADKVLCV